jgi:AcrR family transcriptional regulator
LTTTAAVEGGAQRRRTRRAIVEATTQLLLRGEDPSVSDIAAAADVSRRTVYLHFPTLDQLVLDATIGLVNVDVDAALERESSDDPRARITTLIDALYVSMAESLPLGRKIVKLTVDAPDTGSGLPRRGQRRTGWIEWAVAPATASMARRKREDLVSALATVIGWEAFIVLLDVRGLAPTAAHRVTRDTALTIVDAALASNP